MVNQNKQSARQRATIVAVLMFGAIALISTALPAAQVSAESIPWTELTPATPRAGVNVTPGAQGFSVQFTELVMPETATNLANYYYKYSCLGAPDIALCNPIETTLAGTDATAVYDPLTNVATISWPETSALVIGLEQQWGVRGIATVATGELIAGSSFSSPLQAPTVPGAPVATNPSHVRTLNWSWAASLDGAGVGLAGYEYNLQKDGVVVAAGYTIDPALSLTVDADGTYVLIISAVDKAGNRSDPISGEVTVTTTGPVIAIGEYTDTSKAAVQPVVSVESAGTLTYSWTALSTGVAISNPSARAPIFSVTSDGSYTLQLTVTDEWGNSSVARFTFSYAQPFVPTDDTGVKPIEVTPIPLVTPPAAIIARTSSSYNVRDTVVTTSASRGATGDDQQPSALASDQNTMVDAATTLPASDRISGAIVPTSQGWKIFGLLWYWWALIVAIIVTVWRSVVLTKSSDE